MQLILKKEAVINDNHSFLLSDLPFKAGEKVTVFIVTETDLATKLKKWRSLFEETQTLSHLQEITDSEIDTEITAYRAGL